MRWALVLCSLFVAPTLQAYSVLTHEAIIDSAWNTGLRATLLKRFPNASEEDLRRAHAYAYGGAIIQDLGYYPFGSKLFSDLTHYVRSGDFIVNLVTAASDLNEYAFALGALAHSAADDEGHAIATNRAVAQIYPKLRAKYGEIITYADDPVAHLKVEFGFDVSQVAQGNYAPDAYRDFIGFEVSKPLLQRAFLKTYGLEFDSLFLDTDLALGTYRHTIGGLIPLMTKVAWETKRSDIAHLSPGLTKKKFVYNISRASYRKNWGDQYRQPGCGARFLALLFRLLPKVGPLRSFEFHPLTPETEKLFARSFNATLDDYRVLLAEAQHGTLSVKNTNFDTGKPLSPGYRPADETYAKLVERLADAHIPAIPRELRDSILAYFADPGAPIAARKNEKQWKKIEAGLQAIRNSPIIGKEKAN